MSGAPTFVAGSAGGGGNDGTATATISFPSGATTGDLCVLVLTLDTTALPTAPSGFTLLTSSSYISTAASSVRVAVYTQTLSGAPTPFSFTPSTAGNFQWAMAAYRGQTSVTLVNSASSTTTSVTAPSATAGSVAALVVAAAGARWGYRGNPDTVRLIPASWSGISNAFTYSSFSGTVSRAAGVFHTTVGALASSGTQVISESSPDGLGQENFAATILLAGTDIAPNAPTLGYPTGSVTIDRTVTNRFSWTFSDPDAGDTQSKADLQYRIGTGAWTTLTTLSPNNYMDIASGTFSAANYEWQVRTYDQSGLVGPWSASGFFTAATPPAGPTITAPTAGSTIGTGSANLTWSYPTQAAYEVRKVADLSGSPDTSTIYYDSGNVTDTSTRTLGLSFPVNSRYEHLQVRVQDSGTSLWSPFSSVRVLVNYTPPATPTSVTITAYPMSGLMSVAWTDPTPTGGQPTVAYHNVYRRQTASPTVVTRIATNAAGTSYTDRTPASTVEYQYQIEAVATSGAVAQSAWIGASTILSGGTYGGGY